MLETHNRDRERIRMYYVELGSLALLKFIAELIPIIVGAFILYTLMIKYEQAKIRKQRHQRIEQEIAKTRMMKGA
jgi:hypothetical protein